MDEVQGGCRIHRILLPPHQSGMRDQARAYLSYIMGVKRFIADREYDLVFGTSSRLMTAVLAAYVARSKQARLYLDIRDILVETLPDIIAPSLARILVPLLQRLEAYAVAQAARVNLVSHGFLDYFQERFPRQQFRCFTNGIDKVFVDLSAQMNQSEAATGRPLRVLYAGNIGEGQGLHLIIPPLAMALGERVQFRVVGDGGRLSALRDSLENLGCQNVELLPPVAQESLCDEYRRADMLFLHLNDYSAFRKVLPSKVFEYAATGKPIWAGVAGYAASFLQQEVENAAVFSPCRVEEGLNAFQSLSVHWADRSGFVAKYSRQRIMEAMADDILETLSS